MRTVLLALALVSVLSATASAQAPARVPVQGYLTDADGTPVEGAQSVEFVLYGLLEGGEPLFAEMQTVEFDAGFFTAYVGAVEPLDLSLFRDVGSVFVEISVNSEALSPRKAVGTTPYAAFAEFAGEAERLAQGLSFSELLDVPSGIEDGDDDTTYEAGEGINVSAANRIRIDPTVVQRRVSGQCASGEAARSIGEDGSIVCAPLPVVPAAGSGLTDNGTVRAVDTSVVQQRVVGSCVGARAVGAIGADGSVVCADFPQVPGPGLGLVDSGGDRSVDASIFQRRVNAVCAAGQAIRSIGEDGLVSCEAIPRGDIEGIITGTSSGLTGGCTAGTCNLSVDPTDFNGSTPLSVSGTTTLRFISSGNWTTVHSISVNPNSSLSGEVLITAHALAYCPTCSSSESTLCEFGITASATGNPSSPIGRVSVGPFSSGVGPSTASTVNRFTRLASSTATTFYIRGHAPSYESNSEWCGFDDVTVSAVFIPD